MRAEYPWERRLGAVPLADGLTSFRVWAPRPETLALRLGEGGHEVGLDDAGFGVFETTVDAAGDYTFVVDGAERPDPCTRWHPHGLRGPSRVLDPAAFEWTDAGFTPSFDVLYELHVGTFSPEGTFEGAIP